jgi:parvulin-like peptidyl-prolyl isomerase
MNNKKTIILIAVLGLAALLGVIYMIMRGVNNNQPAFDSETVIALVNGEKITQGDFNRLQTQMLVEQGMNPETLDEASKSQLRTQILNTLISQKLLKQAAAESGINVTDLEVDLQLEQIKNQFSDELEYQAALSDEGISEEQLRSQLKSDMLIQSYLDHELDFSSINPSQEEIALEYEKYADNEDFPPLEEVRDLIESSLINQKQQTLLADLIADLSAKAEIEILIK